MSVLKFNQYLILEQGTDSCPVATQNLEINTKRRNAASPSKSWANVKKVGK